MKIFTIYAQIQRFLFFFFVLTCTHVYSQENKSVDYQRGELLIQLNTTEIEQFILNSYKESGVLFNIKEMISKSLQIWLLTYDTLAFSDHFIIEQTKRNKFVNLVQHNHNNIKMRNKVVPNDPSFSSQWAHLNNGVGSTLDADMDSDEAWFISTGGINAYGDTIVVAVIDEGIDINHNDLVDNLWKNRLEIPGDGIDNDGNGYIDDIHGYDFWDNDGNINIAGSWESHGTHVAGIIGAKGNNGLGVVGVNWDVKIMGIRGSSSQESVVVKSYSYVYEMRKLYNETNGEKGAYIVATNSSFGVDYGDPADYPIWCAMYDSLGKAGILSAVAGPNLNINIDNEGDVPGTCPSNYTICVTNMNKFDNRGSAGYGPINTDIGAPGSAIYSTLPSNTYGNRTGTSMATPQVAGAIALMHAAACPSVLNSFGTQPEEIATGIRDVILNHGFDVLPNLENEVATSGRLNVFNCLKEVGMAIDAEITPTSCVENNGAITTIPIGSTSPYSYTWQNFTETTASMSGLSSQNYKVTVIGANGCVKSKTFLVPENIPQATSSIIHSTCFGLDNGSIALTETSAPSGFSYVWNNGETTPQISGLVAGNYTVSISNQDDCLTTNSYVINETNNINTTAITSPTSCTVTDGSIEIYASGSIAPYEFIWNNGETTNILTGLPAGTYILTITSSNQCKKFIESNIYMNEGPDFSLSITQPLCYGNTAEIELFDIVGNSPYSYLWKNGSTNESVQNILSDDFFDVYVFDQNNCFTYQTFWVPQPDLISANATIQNIACFGDGNGLIQLTASGGVSPYHYLWASGETSNFISNLQSGNYHYTITDNNGCIYNNTSEIVEPLPISTTVTIINETKYRSYDGAVLMNVSGGTSPYSYSWSNGLISPEIAGLRMGEYSVTITDASGCSFSQNFTVDNLSTIHNDMDTDFNKIKIYPNPSHDKIVFVSNIYEQGNIHLFDLTGKLLLSKNSNNKIEQLDLSSFPAGLYFISIETNKGITTLKLILSE
jgi:hypothetical protein